MAKCDFSKKTSSQVWKDILSVANSFGLDESMLKEMFAVSDQGRNVRKCLSEFHEKSTFMFFPKCIILPFLDLDCVCHVLNTVCKRSFTPFKKDLSQKDFFTKEEIADLEEASKVLQHSKIVSNAVR
jgi:hypothetical protein